MKQTLITIIVALIAGYFGSTFFADGGNSKSSHEEKESAYERVLRTNTLRCAYASADPNIYYDAKDDKVKGDSAEFAEEIASALKLDLVWEEEVGFADFAEGLKSGRYDAFCGVIAKAPPRARQARFTDPIYYVPFYAYMRFDETRFKTLEDINKPEISSGVVDGEVFQFITERYLPKTKRHSLVNMTPGGQLFVDLADGKTDVIIHSPFIYHQYTKNNPGKITQALDDALEVFAIAFAVAPGEYDLEGLLNTGISHIQNMGIVDDILDKYGYGETTVYRLRHPYHEPNRP